MRKSGMVWREGGYMYGHLLTLFILEKRKEDRNMNVFQSFSNNNVAYIMTKL